MAIQPSKQGSKLSVLFSGYRYLKLPFSTTTNQFVSCGVIYSENARLEDMDGFNFHLIRTPPLLYLLDIEGAGYGSVECRAHWDLDWFKKMKTTLYTSERVTMCGSMAKVLHMGDMTELFFVRRQ